MSAYQPSDGSILGIVIALLGTILVVGFGITRIERPSIGRLTAWAWVILTVIAAERITAAQPAGFRMVAIVLALLFSMKVVVSIESHLSGSPRLTFPVWCAFAGLWVGMRPNVFTRVPGEALHGATSLIRAGLTRLIIGAGLVALSRTVWTLGEGWLADGSRKLLATLFLLPGLSLILHFGLFNLVAGLWRLFGAKCQPLFRAPLLSKSLAEFWGRRWNLAFSEMTALAIYRPLRGPLGTQRAMIAAFVFSGFLHELAISVPVKSGYGLPLLYFAIQAVGMFAEANLEHRGWMRRPWLARVWTGLWIVLPMPILFHTPFLEGCVWPLAGIGRHAG